MNPSKCPVCDADLQVFEERNSGGELEAYSRCLQGHYGWSYYHGYTEVEIGTHYLVFWEQTTPKTEMIGLISHVNLLVGMERTKLKATQLMSGFGIPNPDAGEYHGHPHPPQTIDLWGESVAESVVLDHLAGTSQ